MYNDNRVDMRMNQDERRFDFHGLGAALKRAREEKGWTQAYVAELVDRDSRTITVSHYIVEVIEYRHVVCKSVVVIQSTNFCVVLV